MENIERNFEIEYQLDWTYGVEISKIREDLDAIEKIGATHVNIEHGVSHDCSYVEIGAYAQRLETDQEMDKRVKTEERRVNQQKQNEIDQLKRLKEKYEE